jgi:hypothetical protein
MGRLRARYAHERLAPSRIFEDGISAANRPANDRSDGRTDKLASSRSCFCRVSGKRSRGKESRRPLRNKRGHVGSGTINSRYIGVSRPLSRRGGSQGDQAGATPQASKHVFLFVQNVNGWLTVQHWLQRIQIGVRAGPSTKASPRTNVSPATAGMGVCACRTNHSPRMIFGTSTTIKSPDKRYRMARRGRG